MKNILSFLILTCLIFGCSNGKQVKVGTEQLNLPTLTISQLQDNLGNYHQKQIELTGYYYSAWETVGLFPDKKKNHEDAVWVDFSEKFNSQFSSGLFEIIEGRKIRMQGTFDRTSKGNLKQYLGKIEIEFIETLD